jgi:hypothetical protein
VLNEKKHLIKIHKERKLMKTTVVIDFIFGCFLFHSFTLLLASLVLSLDGDKNKLLFCSKVGKFNG